MRLHSHCVPTLELPFRGFARIKSIVAMRRFILENGIDIIHSHLTNATYTGYLLGRMTRRPMVSTLHTRTHDLVYTLLMRYPRNRIITVSNFLKNMLLSQGMSDTQVRTIYNGTEFFVEDDAPGSAMEPLDIVSQSPHDPLPIRAELSLPKDAELIGLFGHVDEQKGHPLLVQSAAAIVRRRPKAYFVFVGQADAKMQKTLWEMASADGVADRLRYTGVRNDIARLMDSMDVITAPSQIEACPMVVIEAMARSKAVVAARVGGIPELITHGKTGLLVDRKPDQLVDALSRLLADAEERDRLGRQAFLDAHRKFSARIMVDQIEALYKSLVHNEHTP